MSSANQHRTPAQRSLVERIEAGWIVARTQRQATKSGLSSSWAGVTDVTVFDPETGARTTAHLNTVRALEREGFLRRVRSAMPGFELEWVPTEGGGDE